MISKIANLGTVFINGITAVGAVVIFCCRFLNSFFISKLQWKVVFRQMHFLGSCSLGVMVVSSIFIGMVVAVQGFNTLEKFGAEAQLSQLLALSVLRELGPVISALLYAGRSASALAAEVSLLQVTEQIPAMEVMAINPLNRIILPRWIAGVISLPLLSLIFSAVAIWGGYVISVYWLHIDSGVFWSNLQSSVVFNVDVVNAIYKSIFFSLAINSVALYFGYHVIPNASGVGKATTRTVVVASLLVLLLDFIMTAMMFGG